MANESGDLKLLANFRKLIDLVSADNQYKPSNAALKPPALESQHATGLTAAHDIPATFVTNMTAISDREAVFGEVKPTMSRLHGLAKASGARGEKITDLNTFKRKLIRPGKAKPKAAAKALRGSAAAHCGKACLSGQPVKNICRGYASGAGVACWDSGQLLR